MDEIKKIAGQITGIHTERISLDESFLDFSARFASMPGTTVLMSGGDLDCARHHILGAKPWLTFTGHGRNMIITAGNQLFDFKSDPFDTLHMILKTFSLPNFNQDQSDLPKPDHGRALPSRRKPPFPRGIPELSAKVYVTYLPCDGRNFAPMLDFAAQNVNTKRLVLNTTSGSVKGDLPSAGHHTGEFETESSSCGQFVGSDE